MLRTTLLSRHGPSLHSVLANLVLGAALCATAGAQTPPEGATTASGPPRVSPARQPNYSPPGDIAFRTVSILSEGVRLQAEVFTLKSAGQAPLPSVVQANGWGGTAAAFRADSVALARAGYLVINFDYRGWGFSDGRLVLVAPPESANGLRLRASVEELREYIDPIEQTVDWFNVIHWAAGEPAVDRNRIGLRGTSYSGGHVVHVASRDPRVRAIVSQVGGFNSRWVIDNPTQREITQREATQRAHGEIGYPAPRTRSAGNLVGAPIRDKLALYAPLDDAPRLRDCAALFIVAENEELFSNEANAKLAFERIPHERKQYVSIPRIGHYGIYREARQDAIERAIGWFDQHLKQVDR